MRPSLPLVFLGGAIGAGAAGAAGDMPAFKVERWVNSGPLTADMLRGKVVLLDFWEYTCINWIRTSSYVKAWHRDHGLTYPIALDNDFATWRALGNDTWSAKYLFDGQGRLVKRWVGEGRYDEIEAEIRRLLVAAKPGTQLPSVSPEATAFARTGESS